MDQKQPEWDESIHVEAKYANCFRVGLNEFEMMVDFAQCSSGDTKARAHTRIVTNPEYGKTLLAVLKQSLLKQSIEDER